MNASSALSESAHIARPRARFIRVLAEYGLLAALVVLSAEYEQTAELQALLPSGASALTLKRRMFGASLSRFANPAAFGTISTGQVHGHFLGRQPLREDVPGRGQRNAASWNVLDGWNMTGTGGTFFDLGLGADAEDNPKFLPSYMPHTSPYNSVLPPWPGWPEASPVPVPLSELRAAGQTEEPVDDGSYKMNPLGGTFSTDSTIRMLRSTGSSLSPLYSFLDQQKNGNSNSDEVPPSDDIFADKNSLNATVVLPTPVEEQQDPLELQKRVTDILKRMSDAENEKSLPTVRNGWKFLSERTASEVERKLDKLEMDRLNSFTPVAAAAVSGVKPVPAEPETKNDDLVRKVEAVLADALSRDYDEHGDDKYDGGDRDVLDVDDGSSFSDTDSFIYMLDGTDFSDLDDEHDDLYKNEFEFDPEMYAARWDFTGPEKGKSLAMSWTQVLPVPVEVPDIAGRNSSEPGATSRVSSTESDVWSAAAAGAGAVAVAGYLAASAKKKDSKQAPLSESNFKVLADSSTPVWHRKRRRDDASDRANSDAKGRNVSNQRFRTKTDIKYLEDSTLSLQKWVQQTQSQDLDDLLVKYEADISALERRDRERGKKRSRKDAASKPWPKKGSSKSAAGKPWHVAWAGPGATRKRGHSVKGQRRVRTEKKITEQKSTKSGVSIVDKRLPNGKPRRDQRKAMANTLAMTQEEDGY